MEFLSRIYLSFTHIYDFHIYNHSIMNGIEALLSHNRIHQAGSPAGERNDIMSADPQQFEDLLTVMMFNSQLGGMQSDSTAAGSSLFGNGMMMPLMMNLMEQLMSMQIAGGDERISLLESASSIHINQFEAERSRGGDGSNANCGPASLAMALRAVGAVPASLPAGSLVDTARQLMIDDSSRDGVDASGVRVDWEHNSYTSLAEIARGAMRAGVIAHRIAPDSSSIIQALQAGGSVIVSGTFRGKEFLPWTGDSAGDFSRAPGGATEHFVLVSGYDERTGRVIINDPARQSPLSVYPHTLDLFMRGNEGALAIRR